MASRYLARTKGRKFSKAICFLSVAVLALSILACTKKRDAELSYGEDRDLLEIATYENKEFDLQTFSIVQAAASDKKLKVDDHRDQNTEKPRNFGFVKFESKDPLKLTENTQMLGLENKTYKTKYFFQGNLLKLMKLAPLNELAPDEAPSAIDNKDGRFMVPVVSYEVSFFRIDTKRNDYNEKTSKLELIPLQGPTGATHFKIDYNSKKKAAFLPKTTVLPVSFFKSNSKEADANDWYFAVTFVNTGIQAQDGMAGEIWASDKFGNSATRVRLDMTEKGLNFYNLNVDEKVAEVIQTRKEHQSSALFIPSEFKDFKFEEKGKTSSPVEAANSEASWTERKFVQLKFDEMVLAGAKDSLKISEVLEMQLDDGYLSVLVKDDSTNSTARISIYKVDSYKENAAKKYGAKAYVPKIYLRDDQWVFGFFPMQRNYISDPSSSTQQAGEQRVKLVRYNPSRQFIEYRLNQDAPDWAEEIFTKAIEGWNTGFSTAGSDLRIKYKDEKGSVLRGQVGDLRYSLVNFLSPIENKRTDYLGYGPSVADLTGEIIMSTASLNAKLYLDISESNLETYLRTLKGQYKFKSILGFSFPGLRSVVNSETKSISLYNLDINAKTIRSNSKLFRYFDEERKMFTNDFKLQVLPSGSSNKFGSLESIERTMPLTIDSIEEYCPDFYTYAQHIKEADLNEAITAQERKLLSKCSFEITKPRLVAVLLHELGHSLGLRHNFYGSADANNFYRETKKLIHGKEKTVKWYSSSVMDYLPYDESSMTQPGLYDIAALRWGYTGSVELMGKGIQKSNENVSLKTQFGQNLKPFKYCTDENIGPQQSDPFCARWDIGQDPVEAVQRLINQYEAHVAQYSYRNGKDRVFSAFDQAAFRSAVFIEPMLQFYESWRLILAKEIGQERMYLEDIETSEDYKALQNKVFSEVSNDGRANERKLQAEWNKKFFKASEMVFDFLIRTVLTPDLSCVATQSILGENHVQLLSFDKLQTEFHARTRKTVLNCADPDLKAFVKSNKGVDIVAEGGKSFYDLYADLDKKAGPGIAGEKKPVPEVVGFLWDRFFALLALTDRVARLPGSQHSTAFVPNFMDEKPFRDKMAAAFMNRISKGVDIDSLNLDSVLKSKIKPGQFAVNFNAEKPLLRLFVWYFKQAIAINGRSSLNSKRLTPFSIQPAYTLDKSEAKECFSKDGLEFCALPKNAEAVRLIKNYKEIEKIQAPWVPSNEVITFLKSRIESYFSENVSLETFAYTPIGKISDDLDKLESGPLKDDILRLYRQIFGAEIAVFNSAVVESLKNFEKNENGASAEARQAKIEELRAQPFLKWLKVYPITTYQSQNDIEELKNLKRYEDYRPLDKKYALEKLNKEVNEQIRKKQLYLNDPAEWEAKADILLNSLLPE